MCSPENGKASGVMLAGGLRGFPDTQSVPSPDGNYTNVRLQPIVKQSARRIWPIRHTVAHLTCDYAESNGPIDCRFGRLVAKPISDSAVRFADLRFSPPSWVGNRVLQSERNATVAQATGSACNHFGEIEKRIGPVCGPFGRLLGRIRNPIPGIGPTENGGEA